MSLARVLLAAAIWTAAGPAPPPPPADARRALDGAVDEAVEALKTIRDRRAIVRENLRNLDRVGYKRVLPYGLPRYYER